MGSFNSQTLMLGDIRYALRIAAKQRGFTMLVVLTMALGIGAATATFSIVDTVLLRPLPYKNADRLMSVFMTVPSQRSNPAVSKIWDQFGASLPQFNELKKRQTVFEDMAILKNGGASLETGGRRHTRLGAVSANFFSMLGVQSRLGRLFSAVRYDCGCRVVAAGAAASIGFPGEALDWPQRTLRW